MLLIKIGLVSIKSRLYQIGIKLSLHHPAVLCFTHQLQFHTAEDAEQCFNQHLAGQSNTPLFPNSPLATEIDHLMPLATLYRGHISFLYDLLTPDTPSVLIQIVMTLLVRGKGSNIKPDVLGKLKLFCSPEAGLLAKL